MVSISEAKQSAEKVRGSIQQSNQQIQENLKKIQEERSKLTPKKRVPYTPRQVREAKRQYRGELSQEERRMQESQRELQQKQQELSEYESQIKSVEQAQQRAQTRQDQYNYAVRAYLGLTSGGQLKTVPKDIRDDAREVAESIERQQSRLKDIPQYVEKFKDPQTGEIIEQGISVAPSLAEEAGYVEFESKIPAYYDPTTGRQILQSIDPSIATDLGYQKTDVKGFYPKTGEYVVESKSGFLTPQQQTIKEFYERTGSKPIEIPTTFKIGGEPKEYEKPTLNEFISPTSYQQALRSAPYGLERQEPESWYRRKIGKPAEKVFNRIDEGVDKLNLKDLKIIQPTKENIKIKEQEYNRINKKIQNRLNKGKEPTRVQRLTKENLEKELNILKSGQPLKLDIRGTPVPIFPASQAGLLAKAAIPTGIFFSEQIAEKSFNLLPFKVKEGGSLSAAPSQFGRFGYTVGSAGISPVIATAYGTEFAKSIITNPGETFASMKQYPYETAGFFLYGAARTSKKITNKKIINKLKENIKQLDNARVKSITVIFKNRGYKPNTDRVVVRAEQQTPTGKKVIKIEGDFIKKENNVYFMPEGKGVIELVNMVQPTKLTKPRVYLERQTFDVGQKPTGINLGSFSQLANYFSKRTGNVYIYPEALGEMQTFLPVGKTGVRPTASTNVLLTPRLGPFAGRRMLRSFKKQSKANIRYGGPEIAELSFMNQLGLKINEQTSFIIGKKEKGLVFEVEPKTKLGKKYEGGKKTPLETTFAEQTLVSTLEPVTRAAQKQSQNIISNVVPTDTSLVGIPRMTDGKGLTEGQLKQAQGPSNFIADVGNYRTPLSSRTFDMSISRPSTTYGFSSILAPAVRNNFKERTIEQTKIKTREIEKTRDLQKSRQLEKQRQLERQREKQQELQRQRLIQEQTIINPILGRPIPSGRPKPTSPKLRKIEKDFNSILTGKKPKKKKGKQVLPTVSQQILNIRLKKPAKITGFEIARI